MNKNQLFFGKTILNYCSNILRNLIFFYNLSLIKRNFQVVVSLLFLLSITTSYSQLATENFNSGIPATWAIVSNQTVTNNWVHTPTGGYLGTGGASVNPALNNTVGTTAEYFMITSQFLTPANGEIRFFTKQGNFGNRGTIYQLRISTANQPDISSFNVVLQSWTEAQLNTAATTYEEKIVPITSIPAGIPVYVAFVAITNQTGVTGTSGDTWFVDNVRAITSCPPVTGITTVLGPDTAVINWTHPTATNFGIQVVPVGAGIGTVGTPVSGTTYTATGLTDNTSYDVYIRTDCDVETSSGWAGPFTFRTSFLGLNCTTPIVIPPTVNPYIFSGNHASFYDNTTYTEYDSQLLSCQPVGNTSNQLSGNHIFFSYTPTSTGLIDITQAITVGGGAATNCYNALSSVFIFDSCLGVGTSASCLGAFTTGSNQLSNSLLNFYVTAGNTYIFLISSPYQHTNPGAGLCFTFSITSSTCPAPAVITLGSLQQTSTTASWNNVQNLVSEWQYVAMPVTAGPPIGSTVLTTTNTNVNNQISGLTPGTQYNLYVRSVCGGIPGPWGIPLVFNTLCNPYPLPYYTGFSDASIDCWSQLNLNNDLQFFDFGNSAFSEPVAKCRTQNSNDILISPQFVFDGVNQKRLRFKFNNYGNWGLIVNNPVGGKITFEVRISTTGTGANNFTTVLIPVAEYITAYNYIEIITPIPQNIIGNVNIAWVLPPGALQEGNWFYVDDVYVEDLPACSEPQYPVITPGSITPTSAEVSWINGYNNTQWEIIAQPFGSPAPTATTNGQLINTNPYTLTGLIPSTRYEFYIRAFCSSTVQSSWIGPANFITSCIAQFAPYYESFNTSDVNTKKFCWTVRNTANDIAQWRINDTEVSIVPQGQFMNPFVSFDDWLISVPINVVGLKRLRFNYRSATSLFYPTARGNFEVLMSPTPDFATYTTLIPSHDFTNEAYLEDSVLFTGTGTFYIAFRVPPTMTNPSNSGIVMIDDVVIDDAPPCPNPNFANLDVSNITTTTANLTWTAGYTETQWQVVIQSPLSGVPSGSGTTVNTTPSYNAIGLTPDTTYEYYVRAICSATENSDWVGPFPFKTICNALPTPFIETFDSNSATESCWLIENGNGDGSEWSLNHPAQPIFGDQMAALFTGSNGNNNEWLITPTLMAGPNQRLRFYYKTRSNFFEEDLKVMLSTTGASSNQFTTILYENSLSANTDAVGVVAGSNIVTLASAADASRVRPGDFIYIPGFPFPYPTYVATVVGTVLTMTNNATITQAGVQNIQFNHEVINNTVVREKIINLTNITTPTNINLAFHTPYFPPNPWNYRGQYTFIDNVIVEDIPACPSVINVTTTNIIDTSAVINWEVIGSETSWEISVQPFGTPAPVGATLPQYLVTTSTHPRTISGLIPSTQYQYYIRSVCNSTSQSEWIGPFTFITKCDFSNVCQYKMTVTNGSTGQVYDNVEVRQNNTVIQALEFPSTAPNQPTSIDYDVFLCRGVEFSLYFNAGGGSGLQYSQAQVVIRDELNNIVWTSPLGLGTAYTNIYTGVASCGVVTCPQPTNVTVNNLGTFSWNPVPGVSQYEVFIQPVTNGTIPQSGTIVNSPNYTPTASDFINPTGGTFEFFVRAICSPTDKSFWTGPKVFIRNDESSTAVRLPVNTGNDCVISGINASFIGATVSTNPTTCSGNNTGDIWYDFVATAKVHTIELSDFGPGSYYASSFQGAWPKIMMALYEVQPDGSLLQKGCSEDNSMVTTYTKELVVGNIYKIRLSLDDPAITDKNFKICITTPEACDMNAFNYDFEKLPMQSVTGVTTIINARVIPGWRVNTNTNQMFFQEATNSGNVTPYSGGQCIQLIQDGEAAWDPNDPNIKGMYRDFDTSEIPIMDYNFASATRSNGTTLQLYAGPPSGPFTLLVENFSNTLVWQLVQGNYTVPTGQTTTRFIFRVKNNAIGHVIDAANFKPAVDILTDENVTLNCTTTTTTIEARGIGLWEADVNNPSVATINTPNNTTTSVSGITTPGNYVFHWKTRYCDKTVTITKQGNFETAVVVNPTLYCLNSVASPLTATVSGTNTVNWFTQAVGGTGSTLAPTPSTATVGNSQVFYAASVDANGCEGPRAQIVVQVNDLPTITGALSACIGNTSQLTGSNTAAISNPWISSNLVVATVSNTGLVTGVSVGTTTITYTDSNGCQATATVTVNALPTITGTLNTCVSSTTQLTGSGIAATTNPWISSNLLVATVSNIGLVTGVSAGTATITYSDSNGCQATATVTINALIAPNVAFSYAQTCINAAINPLPVLSPNFATGGVFSATTVTVNPTTGEVNLASTTVGPHVITYTLAANSTTCSAAATATATIVITAGVSPVTGFTYDSNYCTSSANELPVTTSGFTTGGTFTSTPSGLIINSSTGEINFSGSSLGTYTIVYSVAANALNCTIAGSSNFTLTVSAIPLVTIDDICQNQQLLLEALPVNNSFNPDDVTYTWSVSNNPILNSNDSTFNVDEYLEQNPSLSLPLQFSVSVSLNGCEGFSGFEVLNNPCRIIPRGISPNDDGDNDTFDLTGMGVRNLIIFNRYGASVYTYSGTYTNQWEGQSDQGDELPDGTYFYIINTIDGVSKTGWVYINREY